MPEGPEFNPEESAHEADEEIIDDGLALLLKDKILYHGSGIRGIQLFDQAENDTVGKGVYFTSEIEAARGYSVRRAKRNKEDKPVVYKVKVDNAKLVDLRNAENVSSILERFKKDLVQEAAVPNLRWDQEQLISRAIDAINSGKIGPGNLRDVTFGTGLWFTRMIKSLGYDGLVTFEGGEGDEVQNHDTYLIFDPDNIEIIGEEHA